MTRIVGPTGSRRRRRFLLVPMLLIAVTALFWIGSAQSSVHDIAVFQLDGNASSADQGPLNYPGDDWDNICTNTAPNVAGGCIGGGDTAHRVGSGFDYDQHAAGPAGSGVSACPSTPTVYAPGNNCTTFTGGGSKDDGNINGWAWNDGSGGLPDKDNLEQGFSARYTYSTTLTAPISASSPCDPNASTTISIDNTLASWFSSAQQTFQATHSKDYHLSVGGEIMLVTGGQDSSTLQVLRCQGGTAGAAHATGDTVTVSLLDFGATRFDNSGDAQIGIWFFQNGVSLGSNKVGGGTGFSGVHKDGDILILSTFTGGGTTPTIQVWKWVAGQGNNGNTNLQLLSPLAGASCIPVPADGITEVATTSPFCAAVNPADGVSSPWTFTNKRGRSTYDAGEFYEGGLNISAFPQLASECFGSFLIETRSSQSTSAVLKDFLLGPLQSCKPGITTSVNKTDPVVPGDTVTDTATVTGTKGDGSLGPAPTGTVAFTVCGPFTTPTACTASDSTAVSAGTKTLDGTSNPSSVTSDPVNKTATGYYCFLAVYSGDSNYGSASENSTSTECYQVVSIPTDVKTRQSWFPNDFATICTGTCATNNGNLVAGGHVDFFLYDNATCNGTLKYSERQNLSGGSPTEEVQTHNYTGSTAVQPDGVTTVVPFSIDTLYTATAGSSTGSFSWKVVYTPLSTDKVHTGSSSSCTTGHTETFATTYTNDPGH